MAFYCEVFMYREFAGLTVGLPYPIEKTYDVLHNVAHHIFWIVIWVL